MPFHYEINLKEDPIFIEGFEKGVKEGLEKGVKEGLEKAMAINTKKVVENNLLTGEFSVESIASIVDVSIEFVLEIQERLKKEGKL